MAGGFEREGEKEQRLERRAERETAGLSEIAFGPVAFECRREVETF